MDIKELSETETKIIDCISKKQNFLLSGGAGSGKTYTLVQLLNYIFKTEENPSVACITYTNVAADEIKARSPYSKLKVSTIHDFLWDVIKSYQKNIKEALANDVIDLKGEINKEDIQRFKEIRYREYKKLSEGIISHDEVLKISNYLFKTHSLISKILSDKFQYIFIDEYQDTQKSVIEIFLDYFSSNCGNKTVLGFFGDKVQSIYNTGIGNIDSYVADGKVIEILKQQNYRCCTNVIGLLNNIRKDSIKQEATGANKEISGTIKFIYSNYDNHKLSDIQSATIFNEWNFTDIKNNKVLCLTHRLVSKEYGFNDIFNLYNEKYGSITTNLLFGDEKDKFIKYLYRIQELIDLYSNKDFNELIEKTNRKIIKLEDKKKIRECLDNLILIAEKGKIVDLIAYVDAEKLLVKEEAINTYINENKDFYDKLVELEYSQIENLYNYDLGYSPFSTQHGVKGAEYKNVFVLLDNGNWSLYNFTTIFDEYNYKGVNGLPNATQKLFYVCCSRAIENLVVYFNKPSDDILSKARLAFGKDNVKEIKPGVLL